MLRESCPNSCLQTSNMSLQECARCIIRRAHTSHCYTAGLYCERAQLEDGQTVLELGCGWGSLCLYLAEQYPRSEITAVSNSKSQKQLIMQRAKDRKLRNLKVCCLVAQLTFRARCRTQPVHNYRQCEDRPLSQLVATGRSSPLMSWSLTLLPPPSIVS